MFELHNRCSTHIEYFVFLRKLGFIIKLFIYSLLSVEPFIPGRNMQKQHLNVSLKNILIPPRKTYFKKLLNKTNDFVKRLRWRAFHYENRPSNPNAEKFGFKTYRCPSSNPLLDPFENELYEMIRNIKFRKINNNFQNNLKTTMNNLKHNGKLNVHSDKTGNLYQLEPETYTRLLEREIQKDYRKTRDVTLHDINREGYNITSELELHDRTEPLLPKCPYFTLKHHKPDFDNRPSIRLINPTKSDIGRISKKILDRIIPVLKDNIQLPLWKDTFAVIDWFRDIPDKSALKFVQFDIKNYYPSITPKLLNDALQFASTITQIDNDEIRIILHARKSLINYDESMWTKKESRVPFDVSMGATDSAETTDLVGMYILYKMINKFPFLAGGLYRDDGLLVLKNLNPSTTERFAKDLHALFRSLGLSIILETNLKRVNFLDVTLDLNNGLFYPYRKPNEITNYININSNHPSNIKNHIVRNVSLRLSKISATKQIFTDNSTHYNEALKRSGFREKLEYIEPQLQRTHRRRRTRRVTWYNPPYNMEVSTPIARIFFSLLAKHFPPQHKYYRLINPNTVKVSYSTTPNLQSNIAASNVSKLVKLPNNYASRNHRGGVPLITGPRKALRVP